MSLYRVDNIGACFSKWKNSKSHSICMNCTSVSLSSRTGDTCTSSELHWFHLSDLERNGRATELCKSRLLMLGAGAVAAATRAARRGVVHPSERVGSQD